MQSVLCLRIMLHGYKIIYLVARSLTNDDEKTHSDVRCAVFAKRRERRAHNL